MIQFQTDNKIGLIGAGAWGKNLVRVFYELGVLKIICDLEKKVLTKLKRKYPNLETATDFEEILENKGLGAIVISTPATTHYELTRRALLAGKDVFVEKPMALKVKEGKELVKIAQKKKLILMVNHLLLYHPAILKLENLIKKGNLGKIRYICSNRLNFGKLRREENVLWSFAPHDISIIIDILGIPEKMGAIGKSYLQKNIPDVTFSFLEFKNNQAAHIFVSWLSPFKEQKLSVVGSKGMAVFDGVENRLVIYPHKVKWMKDKSPKAIRAEGKDIDVSKKEPLIIAAQHFLECIKKRKTPRTDGKEALEVLKVLDAAQKSLNNKGKTIKLIK